MPGAVPALQQLRRRAGLVIAIVLMTGCAGLQSQGGAAGRRTAPETYVVRSGDTLFSIARRFGIDYRDVARWNRLGDGSLIYPGQRLRLRPHGSADTAAASRAGGPAASAAPPGRWRWPADGTVVLGFGQSPKTASGIVIGGRLGQPVLAAADGDIVYSGSGLPGYGQLLIIRHNAAWLSAYGYNERLIVHEGDHVRAGQQIARMGQGAGLPAALHFEIRRDGEPVNPLKLLPDRP